MANADSDYSAVQERFEHELGGWPDHFNPVLAGDLPIMERFARLHASAWATGPLDTKSKHLILLAINASASHLYHPGVRHHASKALEAGAARGELLDVLELTSVIGIHSCAIGFPILDEESRNAAAIASPLSEEQVRVKERFQRERGWWSDFLESMVRFAPHLVDAYIDYASQPWKRGALEPKMRELIYIAIDAQTTHLFALGLRAHIRAALSQGISITEISQVLALVAGLGFHTLTDCLPIIDDLCKGETCTD